MKKINSNHGITIMALIITILVIAILVTFSIGMFENAGIIEKVQDGIEEYAKKEEEEKNMLRDYKYEVDGGNSEEKEDGIISSYKEDVPIPEGFYYVTGTKDTGLVISDDPLDENNESGKNGNQFVWVPVTDTIEAYGLNTSDFREPDVITGVTPSKTKDGASGTSYDAKLENLEKAGCTSDWNNDGKIDAYDFREQLTIEFNEMTESVNKYKGFYIGRYELSLKGEKGQSKASTKSTPVTSIEAKTYTWYGLYAFCKTYITQSVQSTMIWGSQYDAMISWMGTEATEFDSSKKNTGTSLGTKETDKVRNIYDLAGSRFEYTLEVYDDGDYGRIARGGYWGAGGKISNRTNKTSVFASSYYTGRLVLYLNV